MPWYSLLAIPVAYLIGSFPSTLIIGKLVGRTDMRVEGDGKISAAAVYRRMGRLPYAIVVLMDIGKTALAVVAARAMTASMPLILIAGFFAVVGHCWSVFMKFQGGLGATAICGALGATVFWPLIIGLVVGIIFLLSARKLSSRKSDIGTALVIGVITIALVVQRFVLHQNLEQPWYIVLYPLILISLMVVKRFQTRRSQPTDSATSFE